MIIDNDTFSDLEMTVKAQGDTLLLMAKVLAQDPNASPALRQHLSEMNAHCDGLINMLRAVREENYTLRAPSGGSGRA